MMPVIRPYGLCALLIETGSSRAASFARAATDISGIIDVVVGAETVLLTYEPGDQGEGAARDHFTAVARALAAAPESQPSALTDVLTIPVRYDGEDLAEVAAELGTDTQTVVALHSSAEYRVAFMGFAPGFGYLVGLPTQLQLPRRSTPRTRVPAGSLAIAGEYSAVYPGESPGGWLLLGHTDVRLFDANAQSPALLHPGLRVRFEPQ